MCVRHHLRKGIITYFPGTCNLELSQIKKNITVGMNSRRQEALKESERAILLIIKQTDVFQSNSKPLLAENYFFDSRIATGEAE